MARDRREGRPPEGEGAEEFRLAPLGGEDRWDEAVTDKGAAAERKRAKEEKQRSGRAGPASDPPWDELADDGTPEFEGSSFIDTASALIPDSDEDEVGPPPDDESPPHGDPLDEKADAVFDPGRPSTRMDSLQDALASIRERVQSLSGEVQPGAAGPRAVQTSQLALYRAATDDRTLGELRRHSRDTEDLLRRMSALMQDLSLDLRSIVDAARRAIDQTSEQAESSIELGRLLGERIEQMDAQLAARMAALETAPGKGADTLEEHVDQIDAAVGSLQVHLDKRLTKLEQRSGVGALRDEVGELRSDLGELRADLGHVQGGIDAVGTDVAALREEPPAAADNGAEGLRERLDVVSDQLDRTLTILRDLTEEGADEDVDAVDGVTAAIRDETEAALEPLRSEVEELSRQLGAALDREQDLGSTLATLTDEVQRLRKRIAVRNAPPAMSDDQVQTIVNSVVAALSGGAPSAPARRREPKPEPEPEDELDVPEPEPEPPRRRKSSTRAKKAPAPAPDHEVDINEPFAPGELDIDERNLDVDPGEEPLRRARGGGRKSNRPITKSRRTRSSSK